MTLENIKTLMAGFQPTDQQKVFLVAEESPDGMDNRKLMGRREAIQLIGGWVSLFTLAACQGDIPTVQRLVTPTAPPTHLPTPTTSPTPSPEKTVEPTPTPEAKPESVFWLVLQPFIKEAEKRRRERAILDPEHSHRVDRELNQGRVNFLIFSSGETHEPPLEWGIIASPTIVSLDYVNQKVDIISLTHDIRTPEVELALGTLDKDRRIRGSAQRLDDALLNKKAADKVGKFRLPQVVLENATGLSVDFQIHSNDTAIEKFIDIVFGSVTLEVPIEMPLDAYYFQKIKYPARTFRAGQVTLSGRELAGFIKAIALYGPKDSQYSPLMEHNSRKGLFFDALLFTLKNRFADKGQRSSLINKMAIYLTDQLIFSKDVVFDFDPFSFIVANLETILLIIDKFQKKEEAVELGFPKIRQNLYVVDGCCSFDPDKDKEGLQMPVHWVVGSHPGEDENNEDLREGVFERRVGSQEHGFQKLAYEVPFGGNPYAKDLASGYWIAIRLWVRRKLLGY